MLGGSETGWTTREWTTREHEHYLPLPLFPIPTPPVQDDFADQWNLAEVDQWLQTWTGEFRDLSNGEIPLFQRDVDGLLNGEWLTDEILNGYIILLSARADLNECGRRPYFANTHFWTHAKKGWKHVARRFRKMRGQAATKRPDGSMTAARLQPKSVPSTYRCTSMQLIGLVLRFNWLDNQIKVYEWN